MEHEKGALQVLAGPRLPIGPGAQVCAPHRLVDGYSQSKTCESCYLTRLPNFILQTDQGAQQTLALCLDLSQLATLGMGQETALELKSSTLLHFAVQCLPMRWVATHPGAARKPHGISSDPG